MKGIILAGGTGSRLNPATLAISKQLIPIYDKPMVYYPLSTLMLAEIKDILIITTKLDIERFKFLLGNGSQWGIKISYAIQESPRGIADAFIVAEEFIKKSKIALILGDNIFYGNELSRDLIKAKSFSGATIFTSQVSDPKRYGIVEFDKNNNPINLVEKPKFPKSNYAITGLYFYDNKVIEIAKNLEPSARGELEITDINRIYLNKGNLNIQKFGRGHAWLDTGTHESLLEASQFVATLENRQGLKICCPEEIAYRKNFIDEKQLKNLANRLTKTNYGKYLLSIKNEKD
tara:strand:- start:297 stop:1166 length:870 start_codon:yes stop_codon:yes gene_type:complete